MELLRSLDISEIPVKDEYTGKEIFSFILPDITLEFKAEICQGCEECKGAECEYDAYVIIENGKLLRGTIDEKAVGAFKGIVIDEIARKYGKEMAKKFIDDMTQLAIRIISKLGLLLE